MKKPKVGAPKGNTNAVREVKTDTQIGPFRCKTSEKVAMVKAANGKLAPWVLHNLMLAAKNDQFIQIGDFTLTVLKNKCSIRHSNGFTQESAMFDLSQIERLLEQFFKDNF